MNKWYIMNTKKKMELFEAIDWFGHNCTVMQCTRYSDRGAVDKVYILGASANYAKVGERVNYITDTGRGYGGTGTMVVEAAINIKDRRVLNVSDKINPVEKRNIWVFK